LNRYILYTWRELSVKEEHTIAQEFSKRADLYEKAKWVKDDAFLENLVAFAKLRGDECALEIGIGSGAVAAKMRKHSGILIGVDASKDMLEKAQRYLPRHHLLCCDIEHLASLFLDETFDLVYCRAVLHHVDIPHILTEMHSLIKSGGKLLIAETVAATEEDEAFQLRFVESLHKGHTEFPTADRLLAMIEEAGFEIQKHRVWLDERTSLQNILASTAKSDQEKAEIFTMFRQASEQTKSWWNMLFEGDDILFDKKWAMILAARC
jgi:2-polyprenyl-3-methyl-5-hydroxy-6-metoxy-1,4-benzoquinol methylase